jgi:hypothetical protein
MLCLCVLFQLYGNTELARGRTFTYRSERLEGSVTVVEKQMLRRLCKYSRAMPPDDVDVLQRPQEADFEHAKRACVRCQAPSCISEVEGCVCM